MKGAIIYYSKYGSTGEYATWIREVTGLPTYNIKNVRIDPSQFDYLVLGSPILYYKLSIHKWVKKYLDVIENKPIIFFSVSGSGAGEKLDTWIANSLPQSLIDKMKHVALQGRQIPSKLTLYDRMMLKIGAMFNKDPQARKEELQGFDYMDYDGIEPIIQLIEEVKMEIPFI